MLSMKYDLNISHPNPPPAPFSTECRSFRFNNHGPSALLAIHPVKLCQMKLNLMNLYHPTDTRPTLSTDRQINKSTGSIKVGTWIMCNICIATCNWYLKCNNSINIDTVREFHVNCSSSIPTNWLMDWNEYVQFVCICARGCIDDCRLSIVDY